LHSDRDRYIESFSGSVNKVLNNYFDQLAYLQMGRFNAYLVHDGLMKYQLRLLIAAVIIMLWKLITRAFS